MRKIPFRWTVAVAMLFSMMLWTSGCTSYTAVSNLQEHTDDMLRVTTKDRSEYRLKSWKLGSDSTITGIGDSCKGGWTLFSISSFDGSIPRDSIATIEVESWIGTGLTYVGVAAVAVLAFITIGISANI